MKKYLGKSIHELLHYDQSLNNFCIQNNSNDYHEILFDHNEISRNKIPFLPKSNEYLFYSQLNDLNLLDIIQFKENLLKNCPEFEMFFHDSRIKEHVCLAGGFPGKILTNNWDRSNRIQYYQSQRVQDIPTISEKELNLYLDDDKSDIDFYFYDLNNSNDAEEMVMNICTLLVDFWKKKTEQMLLLDKQTSSLNFQYEFSIIRYKNIITLYVYKKEPICCESFRYIQIRKYQIVCKLNNSITSLLSEFDLGCSQIAYNFDSLYFTSMGKFCFETRTNTVDVTKIVNYQYEKRLIKYFYRGFNIIFPYIFSNDSIQKCEDQKAIIQMKFKNLIFNIRNNATKNQFETLLIQAINADNIINDNSSGYNSFCFLDTLRMTDRIYDIQEHNYNLFMYYYNRLFFENCAEFQRSKLIEELEKENRWIFYYKNVFKSKNSLDFLKKWHPYFGLLPINNKDIIYKLLLTAVNLNTDAIVINYKILQYLFYSGNSSSMELLSDFLNYFLYQNYLSYQNYNYLRNNQLNYSQIIKEWINLTIDQFESKKYSCILTEVLSIFTDLSLTNFQKCPSTMWLNANEKWVIDKQQRQENIFEYFFLIS